MHVSVRHLSALATLAFATATQAAPAAQAANLGYTYVDVGLINTELTNSSIDGDGLLARGSFAIHESFFLLASLSNISYDDDIDGFAWSFGVGGHMPINNRMDLVGRVAYVDQDLDYPGNGSNSDNGYLLSATLRGFVIDKLELEGGVQHVHLDDAGNDTSLIGEGHYFFTPKIAGGVLIQLGDSSAFGINARFMF
jgi:hypothetical protein